MLIGTLFALAAGLMWGLVFIAPSLLPGYPAPLLSSARYLAFVLRGTVPSPATLAGIALLVAGVVSALRTRPAPVAEGHGLNESDTPARHVLALGLANQPSNRLKRLAQARS